MNTLLIVAHLLWLAVLFGQRTWKQVRETGDSGWRGLGGDAVGWGVKGLFLVAVVSFGAGAWLASPAWWQLVVGGVLYVSGFAVAVSGQWAMGRWWRIGVRAGEPVGLVTEGPFRWVRNPIFSGMLVLLAGFVVAAPVTIVGWVATYAALWLQVAKVEEPNLRAVLGETYVQWAAGRGRFLP